MTKQETILKKNYRSNTSRSMVELAQYTSKLQVPRAFEFSPPSLVTCPAGSFQRKASYSQTTCFARGRGLPLVAAIIVQQGKRWPRLFENGFCGRFPPWRGWTAPGDCGMVRGGGIWASLRGGTSPLMSLSVTEPSRQRPYISGWDEFLTRTCPKYTNLSEIRFLTLSQMKHHPIWVLTSRIDREKPPTMHT